MTGQGSGIVFAACGLGGGGDAAPRRREVVVGGARVRTVDIHAHCAVPAALALMGLKLAGPGLRPDLDMQAALDRRIAAMDAQGVDVEALSINPNWHHVDDRDRAAEIIRVQNEALAEACAANPDRFVAFASAALQFPDLAVEQVQAGVKKYGLRGVAIGGNVAGLELSDRRFDPFWAEAEDLGVLVFVHPQADGAPTQLKGRFQGNGYLENVIGNPLETTIALAHLIFEGTLDRHPGLRLCAAHAGGFLPSYVGRFDRGCAVRPDLCGDGPHGGIARAPSDYARQLYYDTMVFRSEGLRHLVAEVGAGQLMIGTDWPYPWTDAAVDLILQAPDLSDADKRAILGETAARLLGIA